MQVGDRTVKPGRVLGVEVDDTPGTDRYMVHLSVTWYDFPDSDSASAFSQLVRERARRGFIVSEREGMER